MSKPQLGGIRGKLLKRLPQGNPDLSPNREVARSIKDILEQVKQREATFKAGTPVGQDTPPIPIHRTSILRTIVNRVKSIWDQDKTLERRKYLIKKIHRSHFQDMVDLKKRGAKYFNAADRLIPAEQALFMPNLLATNLWGKKVNTMDLLQRKVSMVSFEFVKLGGEHVDAFRQPFVDHFRVDHPLVQHVRLNVIENFAKAATLRPFVSLMANQVPPAAQATHLFYFRPIDRIRDLLFIQNLAMGWVFLVDPQLKIRWYANGAPTPEEIERLIAFSSTLANEPQS
ncbi:Mitochondrial ATPase complex subunit atp10 [Dispira simplex]|nr:Mitochondrial ATPase complex subunit atp10 [Dispira simplex]